MSVVKKQSNHNSQSFQGIITRSQWELKVKTTKLPEALEKRGTKLRLVLVLNLIGRESGESFLNQSYSAKPTLSRSTFDTQLKISL